MKEHLQKMLAAVAGLVPDVLMVTGTGAIAYGAWMVYPPAGWLAGGALVLTAGVLAARKAA